MTKIGGTNEPSLVGCDISEQQQMRREALVAKKRGYAGLQRRRPDLGSGQETIDDEMFQVQDGCVD